MNMNSRFSKKIHKHAKKNKKLTKSISSFIQEQEMNVQFDINKNIYSIHFLHLIKCSHFCSHFFSASSFFYKITFNSVFYYFCLKCTF